MDAGGHPVMEALVGSVEDAAAKDHLHWCGADIQSIDGRSDEGDDFVGQDGGRSLGLGVALLSRVQQDLGQFKHPAVGNGAAVDPEQHVVHT